MNWFNDFKKMWQDSIDSMGEELSMILRSVCYLLSGWYALNCIFSPVSEYCFMGSKKYYLLWQKMLFSLGFGSASYGFFKLGRSFRTTNQRNRGY